MEKRINLTTEAIDVVSEFFRQLLFTKKRKVVIAGDPGWRYYELIKEDDIQIRVTQDEPDNDKPGFMKNNRFIGVMTLNEALEDYIEIYNEFSKEVCLAFVWDNKVFSYEEFVQRRKSLG